ncbi:MAG: ABC transporter permease [Burkholderiaceae bacterium]|nr:ABC transporter permease [Burkholderiaceae bacterium]
MSWQRFVAILVKEFRQMRRDRLTFAIMVMVPVMQLVLFGYAINTDPKNLPLAVVDQDHSVLSRSLVAGLRNTGYFEVIATPANELDADRLLDNGDAQFALIVPAGFARALVRGERPAIRFAADATDPSATGNALATLAAVGEQAIGRELTGTLSSLRATASPFEIRVQRRYNPEGLSRFNVVPGLVGVILTMTMVMMTGLAMTRERERGTMENLLATPARPIEVMLGKIVPYILIGYVQVAVILGAARLLFGIPMQGDPLALMLALVLFIAANLAVGFTFSTIARNQLQAMQLTFFFFLPSMLLTGFMFPFRGMPVWAQTIGEALPLTHFLRIVRGILLKGHGLTQIAPHLWPILLFMLAAGAIALARYRRTLD